MGELVYDYDTDWNKPAILLPGAEKWKLIESSIINKGLVADLGGQQMFFLDIANHWIPLVSRTAALRTCQIVGNDNVTVNYTESFSPYYSKMSKACNANSVSFVPTSVCIGTKRLSIEYSRESMSISFIPVDPFPVKRVAGIPPFVYNLCYQPTDHVDIPQRYVFPGVGMIINFLLPLFPDRRRLITYMWIIGNAVRDPVARSRCMMLVGPGGAGKSTALRMVVAALSGVANMIPDGILTKRFEGVNDKVSHTVVKSRMVTCFELDLHNSDINMSMFKNITGSDFVRVEEFMAKAVCSFAIATNGLPNVQRQPDFKSDALTRRMVCVKMEVDTAEAEFESDPSSSHDKMDFLCACIYTRMKYSHLPITPEDLVITLCGNLYPEVMKHVQEETDRPITTLEGRAVLSIMAGILSCDTNEIINRCRLISMASVQYTHMGYVIKGIVPKPQ